MSTPDNETCPSPSPEQIEKIDSALARGQELVAGYKDYERKTQDEYGPLLDIVEKAQNERDEANARIAELEDAIHDLVMPADDQDRHGVETYEQLAEKQSARIAELELEDANPAQGFSLNAREVAERTGWSIPSDARVIVTQQRNWPRSDEEK